MWPKASQGKVPPDLTLAALLAFVFIECGSELSVAPTLETIPPLENEFISDGVASTG
jgi:hypothetical protein